jgi:hypothetical protein
VKEFAIYTPDVFFSQEYRDISYVPERCLADLKGIINDPILQNKPNNLHDRDLRVADQIFPLSPGVDRAGMALTNFGPSDSSIETHNEF